MDQAPVVLALPCLVEPFGHVAAHITRRREPNEQQQGDYGEDRESPRQRKARWIRRSVIGGSRGIDRFRLVPNAARHVEKDQHSTSRRAPRRAQGWRLLQWNSASFKNGSPRTSLLPVRTALLSRRFCSSNPAFSSASAADSSAGAVAKRRSASCRVVACMPSVPSRSQNDPTSDRKTGSSLPGFSGRGASLSDSSHLCGGRLFRD